MLGGEREHRAQAPFFGVKVGRKFNPNRNDFYQRVSPYMIIPHNGFVSCW